MTIVSVLHLTLHAMVPAAVAWLAYRPRWARMWFVMLAAMVVDVDHFLANPIYDPNRCSIGFHPLHTAPAIGAYILLSMLPSTRVFGVGLLIHMALDLVDCGVQRVM